MMAWALIATLLGPACVILGLAAWNMAAWPRLRARSGDETPRVSVLIPARDEEANLPACLAAVTAQGPQVLEILVYDDHSTDGTAAVIADCAARDARVRRLAPSELPEGWCGKPFACAQLAAAAQGPWLLFLDADTQLCPDGVALMLGETEARGATFLSCWPGLDCLTFWERALMPMLNFCVFTLFPAPLSLRDNGAHLGLAHGACIFLDKAAYERVGGHEAVRGELFEDTRLARVWRERGERGLCLDGNAVVRVRMYDSLGGIWRGFKKNYYAAFRKPSSFWLFLGFHAWVMLAPFPLCVAAALSPSLPLWPIAGAAGTVLAMRWLMALRFRWPLWPPLLHPLAETLFLALGLASWRACRSGAGVEWKGRRYRADSQGD